MTNLKNMTINIDDIEYLFESKETAELEMLYDAAHNIHVKNYNEMKYESNIYYPAIYQLEENCPTCGYRTAPARQNYTEGFITKNVEHKLEDINQYPLAGINCYNKDITGIRELLIILNALKKYNLNINVRLSDTTHLKNLKYFDLNSVIYQTCLNKSSHFNRSPDEKFVKEDEKVIKYIKQELDLKVCYEFLINYGESSQHIVDKIREIQKYDVETINIVGYDPFIDSPEEYNPQYSQDYVQKIIAILRIIYPQKELKIQYATHGNNDIKKYSYIGINTITGIYTPRMNRRLCNTELLP